MWTGSTLTTDEVTFWAGARKLGTWALSWSGTQLIATMTTSEYYFAGRLIKNNTGYVASDRLGSIGKFYPWGQEKPSATTNGTEKFTGYYRDSETGNDYAVNRYHQPGMGRFLTADPSRKSMVPGNPGSWNRYGRVGGDPMNGTDPRGLDTDTCSQQFYKSDDSGLPPCEGGGLDECSTSGDDTLSVLEDLSIDCVYQPEQQLVQQQTKPQCSIDIQEHAVGLSGLVSDAALLLADAPAHGYLTITDGDGTTEYAEGADGNPMLTATIGPGHLGNDTPSSDLSFGSITGSFVCDWINSISQRGLLAGSPIRLLYEKRTRSVSMTTGRGPRTLVLLAATSWALQVAFSADQLPDSYIRNVTATLAGPADVGIVHFKIHFDLQIANRSQAAINVPPTPKGTGGADVAATVLGVQSEQPDGSWKYVTQSSFYDTGAVKYPPAFIPYSRINLEDR